MASDKMRAAIAFAKFAIALAVGYGIYYLWNDIRVGDEMWVPYAAGAISAIMVFFLLSRLNKGGDS